MSVHRGRTSHIHKSHTFPSCLVHNVSRSVRSGKMSRLFFLMVISATDTSGTLFAFIQSDTMSGSHSYIKRLCGLRTAPPQTLTRDRLSTMEIKTLAEILAVEQYYKRVIRVPNPCQHIIYQKKYQQTLDLDKI